MSSYWNRARSEALEGRVGFGCPCAEVGKEDAQVDQPAVCGWTYFFAGSGAALNGASTYDRMRDIVADVPSGCATRLKSARLPSDSPS